ncbi:DoxX family protein [Georgenia sp. H159]|uniref:DoxX family protein n=1 Tax=Georgenia sp. H159 TaxID=3076115 RepID=UPI002D7A06EE|nr:DoxX family protein [Georgenia sp. H159]
MGVAQIALAGISCLLLLVAALSKVTEQQSMRDMAAHVAIPWPRYRAIGYLELLAVVGIVLGLWWAWIGVAAGTGTVLLLVGAVVVHTRAGDPLPAMVPALATLASAAGYVAVTLAA